MTHPISPKLGLIHCLGLVSLVVPMTLPLAAQSTWTGASGPSWTNTGNWNPASVPASGVNITISDPPTNNGVGSLNGTDRTIGSLTFGTTGTRTSAFTLNTTTSTLIIGGGVVANGALTGSTNVLTLRGNYNVSANQNWSVGGTANTDNGVFIRGTSDSAGAAPSGSLLLNANLVKKGTGQLNFAAVTVSGAGNLVIDEGNLKFNAGSSQPLIVGGPGNITMNGSTVLGIFKNSGTMNITRAIVMNGTSKLSPRSGIVDVASSIAFNGTHSLDPNVTTNLSGAWTGSGTVNRSEAGTLNLTGSLSGFTGALNLTGGITNISSGPIGGSLSLDVGTRLGGEVAATGALSIQDATFSADPTTPGSLGTGANLTLGGINTVTLSKSPTSTAPFTVLSYSGTLTGGIANLTLEGGATNYRSVTFSDSTPGIITLAVGSSSRTWTGASGTAWDVDITPNWLEGDQRFFQLDAVTFGDTGAGTVALTGALSPGSIAVNSASNYEFTGDAANHITGSTGLTKGGSGTLTLGGVNTFTGAIAVNGGVLKAAGNQALGANGNTITIAAGATLDTNGALNASRNYHAVISGTGTDGFGVIVNNSGTDHLTGFGSLTLAADATIGGSNRWDVRPIVAGDGLLDLAGHTLTKLGNNRIGIIDSMATAAGPINVEQGSLSITRSTVTGSGTVTVGSAGTLQFENNTAGSFTKNITLDNGALLSIGTGTFVPVDSPQIALIGLPVIQTDVNLTLTGQITGAGKLTKAGSATLVLADSATHTGGTLVNAGTLQIGVGGTTGSIVGDIENYGTVAFNRSDAYAFGNAILGTGSLLKQGTGTLTLTGTSNFTGEKVINDGTLVVKSSAALGDITGLVRFTGANGKLDLATNSGIPAYPFTIGAGNTGTILSGVGTPGSPGVNHTLGDFAISAVTLNVAASADVSGGDPRITIPSMNLAAGAGGNTTLSPTTAGITLGSATIGSGNAAKTLVLTGTHQNNLLTGVVSDGLNVLSLTKTNDSLWTVSGDSTFTGTATISDGILVMTHSNALGAASKTVFAFGNAGNNQFPELRFSGGISPTFAEIQTSGAGTDSASGVLRNFSGDNTLTVTNQITMRSGVGATTLYSDAGTFTINTPLVTANVTNRALILAGPGNGVINGVVANGTTVNLPVTKNGTGTWTINGAQTYTGTTTVTEGVLSLGQAALSDTAAVVIGTNGKLNLNFGGTDRVGALEINGLPKGDGLYSAATDSGFITGSGSIRVGPEPAGYATWASGHPFNPGVNDGINDDPDADGVSNLLEYVLGGVPVGAGASNTSILPTQTLTTDNLVLTFKRSDVSESDTTLKVQWSDNLSSWNDFATIGGGDALPKVDVTEDSPTAALDTVVVTVPRNTTPGGKLFVRLQAVK
ncbi:autotransporter-associated beta strand repeat-containing protein [Luteolibacter arcticus]|uniref:Autotransporter-associated beta strand repeat-containing protein n=1 Tax=Luteolibacter arcticus TaxID=1581411 RepID=A0ABT3GPE0_9BACT|nr:autotransporter-associated beta strand repeat-containing protein [Luteolibacter arcticus]MCW1925367.1 autotransporter-associated beta strand repeat-containing protein [Luteolibacter arcticus]